MTDQMENEAPKPWLEGLRLFLLIAVLFFGGMFLGFTLAKSLAPGSNVAAGVGLLMLPISLGIGWKAWYATATAAASKRLFKALFQAFRGKDFQQATQENLADLKGKAPPGTNAFVVASFFVSLTAGTVIGLSPHASSFLNCLGITLTVGLGYGLLLRWLARTGYLPLPEG